MTSHEAGPVKANSTAVGSASHSVLSQSRLFALRGLRHRLMPTFAGLLRPLLEALYHELIQRSRLVGDVVPGGFLRHCNFGPRRIGLMVGDFGWAGRDILFSGRKYNHKTYKPRSITTGQSSQRHYLLPWANRSFGHRVRPRIFR